MAILYPLEWVVANLMVLWHSLWEFVGINPASGIAWALSIVGLVVTIRVALIPLFVKQIKAQRAMQVVAPELRKVQEKYKGKKDQASREAMTRETMALYSKHKTSPFASCMPILIQSPIFIALFFVLNTRLRGGDNVEGIGLLTSDLARLASNADFFGAHLSESFFRAEGSSARIVAAVLILFMVATSFFTSRQIMRKNMPASAMEGPMAQQQKIMMYALPFIFLITGPNFPLGVLIYMVTTNLWTMGQQYYVIKRNPTPGSAAALEFEEKKRAKALRRGEIEVIEVEEEIKTGQRQQPKRKNRNKR